MPNKERRGRGTGGSMPNKGRQECLVLNNARQGSHCNARLGKGHTRQGEAGLVGESMPNNSRRGGGSVLNKAGHSLGSLC